MIIVKTKEEIELMRQSALIVSKTLGMLAKEVKEGVTTKHLDTIAEEFIRDHGALPGFKGLYDCPSTLLCSVNDAVVHGLPTHTPLKNGDIVSIDCGALMNDFYGDHAYTFEIGEVSEETKKLIEVTKKSLYVGIAELKVNNRVGLPFSSTVNLMVMELFASWSDTV
jgi:methionyl aminopeptidase